MRRAPIALSLLTMMAGARFAAGADKPSFAGLWRGTSVCQIKDSPCRDEGAVYTVKKGARAGSFEFSGDKVVEGKRTFMGLLECGPGAESDSLVCRQGDAAVWTWTLEGDAMRGTLVYRGQLYRKVQLTRDSSFAPAAQ